eukprot:CCRYP_001596-RA/>CCRYP_001596-RA protein AED:0.10 eAED:0.10 QI:1299/1/1/1/0.55/0.6/10/474/1295
MGDLTYLKPTSTFQGFQPMTTVTVPLLFEYWSVQETDNMPRWFVVHERDQSTAVIENTDTEVMHDFVLPYTSTMKTPTDNNIPMTAASRFSVNMKTVQMVDAKTRIIPAPYKTIVDNGAKPFDINGVSLVNPQLLGVLSNGALDLLSKLGVSSNGNHKVSFSIGTLPVEFADMDESYSMEVTTQGTKITGADTAGLFNGFMSFIGLLDVKNNGKMTLTEMTVHDKPRFGYRGHQVDTARNFRSKEAIMKTIDAMALWKLNVMHLALTNDEGWRLEIPGLEELTSVGSRRCFDPNEDTCILPQLGSGPDPVEGLFYTREEFIDILKYAHARNVKIIPEFNMPAHARAAVISMEARAKNGDVTYRLTDPDDKTDLLTVQFYDRTSIINPCLDSSVRFVEKLVGEVKLMYDDAGIPLDSYHFGGDEAKNILLGNGYASYAAELKQKPFSKSPACEAKGWNTDDSVAHYWAITVNKILATHGIREMIAWHDGLRGTSANEYQTPTVAINFWDTLFWGGIDSLTEIDQAMDIILASPDYLYFDFPYEVNPEERGYYWGARFNSVYKVFTYAPENLAQNAETSTDRDGNEMNLVTPAVSMPVIRGIQGQTWSETIRTDDQYFEMAFPRALAVAERAWHRASWEMDWSQGVMYNMSTNHVPKDDLADDYKSYASVLGCREVIKLRKLGIAYRIPPPGGSIDSFGMLSANSELPCTIIMYSTDQGSTWSYYSSPVYIGAGQVAYLKSMSADGTLQSRVVLVDEECHDCMDEGVSYSTDGSNSNIESVIDNGLSNQNSQSDSVGGGSEDPVVASASGCSFDALPLLIVPNCITGQGSATINRRLGSLAADFPEASVRLCFTDKTLELTFEAKEETSYLVNDTFANNDPLWMWTVMEAFIALGDNDPTEYLEFEVAPNNRIWTGYIHNPMKDFSSKATAFIDDWNTYPIISTTTTNPAAKLWKSVVSLPLSMFNVEKPEGTVWRMNFFRTYYADENSEQEFGAWNPNKLISFHQTPCFGKVHFDGGVTNDVVVPSAVGSHGCTQDTLPHLNVPHCRYGHGTATINRRLGTLATNFPEATVRVCFTENTIELIFEAHKEISFVVNNTHVNNDPLWMWTVMEAFIAVGEHDPTQYLEFEIAPSNRIWTGFIHNPTKDFSSKGTAFIDAWETYPMTYFTVMDIPSQTWKSNVSLPLSMFNVEKPEGTVWRMNFFRTYYAVDENSEQEYGAWNPNKQISFHQTPCFGKVLFVERAGETGSAEANNEFGGDTSSDLWGLMRKDGDSALVSIWLSPFTVMSMTFFVVAAMV